MQYKSILRLILLVVADAIAQNVVCLTFVDIIGSFLYFNCQPNSLKWLTFNFIHGILSAEWGNFYVDEHRMRRTKH